MFITAVSVRGFADLIHFELRGLGRMVELRGSDPACTALGDAIQMLFAALDETHLRTLLERWELLGPNEEAEITGEPFPDQATWCDGQAARALIPPGPDRHLRIEAEIELDPILYGHLRSEATRDPRLVIGLSENGRIKIEVGLLFANSFDALAIHIQRFEVGNQAFSLNTSDRPMWLNPFLRRLAGRFHRHDPQKTVAETALQAATSSSQYQTYTAWQDCLGQEHKLRAARGAGDTPIILEGDLPLRRWGIHTVQKVRLGASIHLSGADIVWAEHGPDFLEHTVSGPASPLEQVFCIHPDASTVVESITQPDPPTVGVTSRPQG